MIIEVKLARKYSLVYYERRGICRFCFSLIPGVYTSGCYPKKDQFDPALSMFHGKSFLIRKNIFNEKGIIVKIFEQTRERKNRFIKKA